MPDTTTTPAVDRTAQIQAAAAAIQDIAAVIGSPNRETGLAVAKQALTSIGTALVGFGVLNAATWGIISILLGAALTAAGAYWHIWDDRRAANAVRAANENHVLGAKLEAIAARHAAATGDVSEAQGDTGRGILPLLALFLLPAALLFGGCAHVSTIGLDNTPTLMARPDFEPARAAAPEWTQATLATIARLEYEVEAAAPFGVIVVPSATTATAP
jgi:hypothetical protein